MWHVTLRGFGKGFREDLYTQLRSLELCYFTSKQQTIVKPFSHKDDYNMCLLYFNSWCTEYGTFSCMVSFCSLSHLILFFRGKY